MTLSDEHLQKLYRYGISLSHDETHAYDLLQDALEAFLNKPPTNLTTSMAYIRRIMRNRYIDQYRHRHKFPEESFDLLDDTLSIDTRLLEDILITREQLEIVWLQLSDVERDIIFLWAVEGLTANEISIELELPRGSVLSKIYRLRDRMNNGNNTSMKEGAL